MKLMHRIVQRATDDDLAAAERLILAEILRRKGIHVPDLVQEQKSEPGTISEQIDAAIDHLYATVEHWQASRG